jgi:selenocysteine lyase/cysteine desulfurase
LQIRRRTLLKSAAASFVGAAFSSAAPMARAVEPLGLSAAGDFLVGQYEVCLNNARWHPMSRGARAAAQEYMEYKSRGIWTPWPGMNSPESVKVRQSFAELIGAKSTEIAFVNSTTAGENLVVSGLGLQNHGKGNIVTDALHFDGSLYMYQELAKRGVEVRIVKPRGWQITMEDMAAAVDKNTKLVSISAISWVNGFQHDVKAVCDLAHAHGAYVYLDAVQAAGCMPLNVKENGVDFLATASYKWLQGDFGLGFLYVNEKVLPKLERVQWSFRQVDTYDYHAFPGDPDGQFPASYEQREDAAGHFEVGTYANGVLAVLTYSLPYIQRIGVDKIQKHALELNGRLRAEMPKLGYPCITPEGSSGAIIAFAVKDDSATAAKLKAKKVDVGSSRGRIRVSPSVYNTHADVDALLSALS